MAGNYSASATDEGLTMNRLQKTVVTKLITVLVITGVAVTGMANLRSLVNRKEAKRGMEQLQEVVDEYRKKRGIIPPESYISRRKTELGWDVRLNDLRYRALWVTSESGPDEILAYTRTPRGSFFVGSKHLVLRLDGRVEWVDKKLFKEMLAKQQNQNEIQMLQKSE